MQRHNTGLELELDLDFQKKELHWLKASAEQGYANAQYNLGFLYERGWVAKRCRSGMGNETTHWRTGTRGMVLKTLFHRHLLA